MKRFSQKNLFGQMVHPHAPFRTLHNEKCQQVNQNNINDFSQKILVWENGPFQAPKMPHPRNGSTLRIVLKFCPLEGVSRQMKVILIVFTKVFLEGTGK